ncbi:MULTISPECIES: hypothetical protein [Sphingomonas]|uniref:hypothetical protein n=1 Tax=Sphingomonas TaxID=13687 RepID=UPI000DEFCAC7|nr:MULTISPECIES: hypothetical protein [Sphingomonas]
MRFLPVLTLPLLSACAVANTAVDVVTLPVKVVSKGVDLATTSQSEADQKRGRRMREAEERYGRALREWDKACRKATAQGKPCPPRPEMPEVR